MQMHVEPRLKPHAQIWRATWELLWTAAFLTTACASSPGPHITAHCVPAPMVTPCQPPREPVRLETQADLLTAYIDALAAWASCRAEVEKVRRYYEIMEGTKDED